MSDENPLAEDGDDPAESLCDSMVSFLSDEARDFPQVFEAKNPEDPFAELYAEDNSLRVLVTPTEDAEERIGTGPNAKAEHTVVLIVLKKMDKKYTRRNLNRLTYELRCSLRGVEMSLGKDKEGVERANGIYQGAAVITKYDPELIKSDLYFSATEITYMTNDC